jgi:glycosyltransferase involved in cell wall biosynthesis
MSGQDKITILCPTYNEVNYIENILHFFVDSLPENKELYIIDGGSTDGTTAIVEQWMKKHNTIHLLNNPHKYVPQALNLGLKASSGNIVVRLDAHTVYNKDYVEKIIETFNKTDADIVGGPMNAKGTTTIQKAIAYCTSNWFGIGNSKFHDVNFSGYVDSVYLGAWKRAIFNDVGYFDEQMMRNQDDEFHYRAKSKGKKIYLNAEIQSTYFPRSSFKALFKQYFQYGLYKPLVIKKIKSEVKLRHLVPLFFVLYLLSLVAVVKFPFILIPLFLYLIIDLYKSFANKEESGVKLASLLVYPILHLSYGLGFLLGIFKKVK